MAELLVVISIIIVTTGISVPLMTSFLENRRVPRAAKILATQVRHAQISALNFQMDTQIELGPNVPDRIRIWGYSAQVKNPQTWDGGDRVMISEARRLSREGGQIRFLPLNKYSHQPQNSKGFKTLSGREWEFCELKYTDYAMQACYQIADTTDTADDWREWEVTPELRELIYAHTGTARSSTIGQKESVGVQVLLSTAFLPEGTGIDPVNYVSYYDANRDGMPDGNPLALRWDTSRLTTNNHNFPLIINTYNNAPPRGMLYKDTGKRIPAMISGSLMFSREGTLNRTYSLRYYASDPLGGGGAFFRGIRTPGSSAVYGFVVWDRGFPKKKMMVEVSGMGQCRRPYGVFTDGGEVWGSNFNPCSERGS